MNDATDGLSGRSPDREPVIYNEDGHRVLETDSVMLNFANLEPSFFDEPSTITEPSSEERTDGEAVRPTPDWPAKVKALPKAGEPTDDPWAARIQKMKDRKEAPTEVGLTGEALKDAKYLDDLVRIKRLSRLADRILAEEQAAAEPPIKLTFSAERKAKPPKSWVVDKLSLAGPQVGVYFGRRGLAKTFKLVGLGLSLVNDLDQWMGLRLARPADQIHVVFVLGEGTAGFQDRIDSWLEDNPGCSDDNLVTIEQESVGLTTDAGLARFIKTLRDAGVRPCQIVFDTQGLTCAAGVDENSRSEMREVYRHLKLLSKEFDCTVIAVTHPGNDPKTWNRPAGASTQEQDADFMVNLRWTKARGNHVIVEKVKEAELGWGWTFTLRKVGEALVVDYGAPFKVDPAGGDDDDHDAADAGLVDLTKGLAIYKAIEAESGISQTKLCTAVSMHKDDLTPLRDLLVEKGVIRVEGGGTGKPTKHYTAAPWATLLGFDADDAE